MYLDTTITSNVLVVTKVRSERFGLVTDSVIFVNKNENENGEQRENNEFVNENLN